jgi:O-antigen/teichoic acid export membrane protein
MIFAGENYTEASTILKILSLGLPGYILFPLFTQNLIMIGSNRFLFLAYFFASLVIFLSISISGSLGFTIVTSSYIVATVFNLFALTLSLFCIKYTLNVVSLRLVNRKFAAIFVIYTCIIIKFSAFTLLDLIITILICIAVGFISLRELKNSVSSKV